MHASLEQPRRHGDTTGRATAPIRLWFAKAERGEHMRPTASTCTDRPRRSRAVLRGALVMVCALLSSSAHPAGAGVWTSNGPVAGYGTTIAVDPTTPSTMYVGSNGAGVFKSTDGGASWHAVNTGFGNTAAWNVTALVVDPSAPARVYATVSSGPSGGVFRTTNGGASWTFVAVGSLTDIALDPAAPATLYATGFDLYKSTNAGVTWAPVLAAGDFRSVTVDPSTPGTVYAGTLFGAIAKTTNGGASWTWLGNGLASDHVEAIAVDPTSPSVVYAGLEDFGVYKSGNGGTTWTPLGPTIGAQKFSVEQLVIDPSAPGTVYAAGYLAGIAPSFGVYKSINGGTTWSDTPLVALVRSLALVPTSPATLIAGTQDGIGIWKSIDGGTDWSEANVGFINTNVGALATAPSAPDTLYAGTVSNGVFRSDDGGATWSPTGFTGELNTFYALAVDPTTPETVYLGTQFDGVYKTIDGGDVWSPVGGFPPGLIGALVVDPSNPAVVYAGGFGGVARSANGGATWTPVTNNGPVVATAFAIDPAGTLYAGSDPLQGPFTGVYKTSNGGAQWTQVNSGLPTVAEMAVQALAIDPSAAGTLYVGLELGGVYKTTDGGATWAPAGGLGGVDVRELAVDPVLPGTVYAGTELGVYTSTNGGASWALTNVGLYNQSVRSLATAPGRVWVGTAGGGVFAANASTVPPQVVRGKSLVIQNPKVEDPRKRKITVAASESASTATIDLAALLANGATLTVSAQGPDAGAEGNQVYSQTFPLPALSWTRLGTTGARYADKTGAHGPVTSVTVVRSASGVFTLKTTILGKNGPGAQPHVVVLPPNPGIQGQVRLEVDGGASYCVGFGGAAGGTVVNQGATLFKVTNPTTAVCM